MKIALLAPSPVPFVIGGAEVVWSAWVSVLNQQPGVEAELIKIPSPERSFWEIVSSYRRFAELDVTHFDRVVSAKYPTWMVSHPDHHVYLFHKLRGLYDTWPDRLSAQLPSDGPAPLRNLCQWLKAGRKARNDLPELFDLLRNLQIGEPELPAGTVALPGALLKAVVHTLDDVGLSRTAIRRYSALSATVAGRAGYFPPEVDRAEVEVIHPPTLPRSAHPLPGPTEPEGPLAAAAAPGLFTASRLDGPKRMDWVIEAHRLSGLTLPLVVAGDGPQRRALQTLAADQPLVSLPGRLTDVELARGFEQAMFVPYAPNQEDYGLITLEALQAGKPVVTTADAGGVTELVQHGVNGLVMPPTPQGLADGMRQLATNPDLLAKLSAAAEASVAHITWERMANAFATPHKRIAVVNTFALFPPQNGGQVRMLRLYAEVARFLDVRVVSLAPAGTEPMQRHLAPGLLEVVVPASPELQEAERALSKRLRCSCSDVAAMLHPDLAPQWLQAIADACQWAQALVACHPYALPAIRKVWAGPVVYESLNVEADLKAAIFGHDATTLAEVERVEQACARQAPLVLCCSTEDAERMQARYNLPALPTVVPNGVDVRAYPSLGLGEKQALRERLGLAQGRCAVRTEPWRGLALYVGSLHGPNVDALLAMLPVAAACPEVLFAVVGSVCEAPQVPARSALPPNLLLVGRVTDAELKVWLAAADVGLNPMRTGSGTNLKMLEYAAAGLPILSTPFGGRGGLLQAPAHYEAAELPEFALRLQRMIQKEDRESIMNKAIEAKKHVSSLADWRVLARTWLDAVQPVVDKHA